MGLSVLGKERDPFIELEKEVSILLGETSSSKITKRKLAKYNLQYIHVHVHMNMYTCIHEHVYTRTLHVHVHVCPIGYYSRCFFLYTCSCTSSQTSGYI